MAFDPVAYSRMLDESLGFPGGPRERGGMGVAPPQIGAPPAPRQGGSGPAAQMPPLGGGAPMQTSIDGAAEPAPVGQAPAAAPTAPGKIQALPPFKLKFKDGAPEKVKTPGDLVNAMTPSSQRKYMDWWEQQHGAINEKYAQLQQDLGRRPEADGNLSRKEQFRLLMEFGVELMARSGRGEPGAGGNALASSLDRAEGRKQMAVADYDARSQALGKARSEDLKSIGTYGDAMKGQSAMDQDAAQIEEARARTKNANRRKPEIISADQGTFDYDPETQKTTPITGIDGKPLTNREVGRRGGSAAGRDSRTAKQKDIEDLIDRGMPEQLAVDIVHKRISDPRKAWQAIYRDRRRQYASEQEARDEADKIISQQYGDDWQDQGTRPSLNKDDPLGLR